MPATDTAKKRLTTREVCTELGIGRTSLYATARGQTPIVDWFTDYSTPGGRDRRFCAIEVAEAAMHLRGKDGRARAYAAVLRLRKELGRL